MSLVWENAETTRHSIMPLAEGFMWLVDDEDRDRDAVAVVSRDRELYGDDLFHWKIGEGRNGICATRDEAKQAVEAVLGQAFPYAPDEPAAPGIR